MERVIIEIGLSALAFYVFVSNWSDEGGS